MGFKVAHHPTRLTMVKHTSDNGDVKKENKPVKFTKQEVREAAIVLGTSSWRARTEKYSDEELSVQMSIVGKLGGRPRKVAVRP